MKKSYVIIGLALLLVVTSVISVMADSDLGDNFVIPGYFVGLINRSYVVGQQEIDDWQNQTIQQSNWTIPYQNITNPPWLTSYSETDPVWGADKSSYATKQYAQQSNYSIPYGNITGTPDLTNYATKQYAQQSNYSIPYQNITNPPWLTTDDDSSYATKNSPTFTGTVTIPSPFTIGATSVTTTGTELNYVVGVTSAIQTQLNGKQASLGYTAENAANKGASGGYAPLTGTLVPTANLGTGSATSSTFLRGDQTWATPSFTLNSGNLLSGLTPTFTGWNTNPGTNANLVDETSTALTTSGVSTSGAQPYITYDLGSSKRVIIYLYMESSPTGYGCCITISTDGTNYYNLAVTPTNSWGWISIEGSGVARYIRFYGGTSGGSITYTKIKMRVYNI